MLLHLVEKIQETDDVITFVWQPSEPLQWQAGQFMKYTLPHENADDRGESRWFTIAAPPYEAKPRITTRFASDHGSSFKQALRSLEVGATIQAGKPMGDFVEENPDQPFVFVAGGIGITPFRAMLLQLDHDGADIVGHLLYANRNDQIPFQEELETLAAKHANFQIQYFLGDNFLTQEAIKAAAKAYSSPSFYLSGPEPMVGQYKQQLLEDQYSEEAVKTDYFPGYTNA
jgi:ferredoxin-NADP reductase